MAALILNNLQEVILTLPIAAFAPSGRHRPVPVIQYFLGVPRGTHVNKIILEQHLIHDEEPSFLTTMRSQITGMHAMGLEDHEIGRHIEVQAINEFRDLDIEISTAMIQTGQKTPLIRVTFPLFDEPTDDQLHAMLTALVENGHRYHEF